MNCIERVPSSLAVMQPYLFPYLGYYQLVNRVETFVFLDDVNFIKRGFINRNQIRVNNAAFRFVLPVAEISQNRRISDHYFSIEVESLIKTVSQAYRRAPYYSSVMPIVEGVICQEDRSVSRLTANSIRAVFDYLQIEKRFMFSSDLRVGNERKGQARIIDICNALGAKRYSNAIGGINLYHREEFSRYGIELEFVRMKNLSYRAPKFPYMHGLSIIDVLMLCSISEIRDLLELCETL